MAVLRGKYIAINVCILKIRAISNKRPNDVLEGLNKMRKCQSPKY